MQFKELTPLFKECSPLFKGNVNKDYCISLQRFKYLNTTQNIFKDHLVFLYKLFKESPYDFILTPGTSSLPSCERWCTVQHYQYGTPSVILSWIPTDFQRISTKKFIFSELQILFEPQIGESGDPHAFPRPNFKYMDGGRAAFTDASVRIEVIEYKWQHEQTEISALYSFLSGVLSQAIPLGIIFHDSRSHDEREPERVRGAEMFVIFSAQRNVNIRRIRSEANRSEAHPPRLASRARRCRSSSRLCVVHGLRAGHALVKWSEAAHNASYLLTQVSWAREYICSADSSLLPGRSDVFPE